MNKQTEAFKRYLDDCDKHAIVPDIAGAFHFAWQEALAQPEQEPVAYLHQCGKKPELKELSFKKNEPSLFAKGYKSIPLVYTTPPHHKPLTDEQMWELWNSQGDDAMEQQAAIAFARAIEAAHGITKE